MIVEQTIRKIASLADDSEDMRSLSKRLIKNFDQDSDGIISFGELSSGLKSLNIFLTADEREALMQKLDINKDGDISD